MKEMHMHSIEKPLFENGDLFPAKSASSHFSSGVQTVVADLHQDGDVYQNLGHPTHPELGGAFINHKVRSLENVTSGPQEHHLYAGKKKRRKQDRYSYSYRKEHKWKYDMTIKKYFRNNRETCLRTISSLMKSQG